MSRYCMPHDVGTRLALRPRQGLQRIEQLIRHPNANRRILARGTAASWLRWGRGHGGSGVRPLGAVPALCGATQEEGRSDRPEAGLCRVAYGRFAEAGRWRRGRRCSAKGLHSFSCCRARRQPRYVTVKCPQTSWNVVNARLTLAIRRSMLSWECSLDRRQVGRRSRRYRN